MIVLVFSKYDLIRIPCFDMVNSFPLDYMYLITLGEMRKLINLWMHGPLTVRLPSLQIKKISNNLPSLKSSITNDFKANELRQFLIYTGPLALRNILTERMYSNFTFLNISMTILLSSNISNNLLNYSNSLLIFFISDFENIYGKHMVSHNIHGLTHIVLDYQRKHKKPLELVIKRYQEKTTNEIVNHISNQPIATKLSYEHSNGPLIQNTCEPQYLKLILHNKITINIRLSSDSYVLTNTGEVVQVKNFVHYSSTKEVLIIGFEFLNKCPFYDKTIRSSKLNIFIVQNLSKNLKYWKITEIKNKIIFLLRKDILPSLFYIHFSSSIIILYIIILYYETMWLIVNFLSDNSVSAVPTTWLKNGYCPWLKQFIKNKNKFIEKKIKPGKYQFDFYKVRLLSEKPIASYAEARLKALKAQNTSDLSSAEDIDSKSNKKIKNTLSIKSVSKEINTPPEFSGKYSLQHFFVLIVVPIVFENTDIYDSDEDKLYVPPINSNDGHLKKKSSNNELLCGKQLCASPLNFNHLENDNIDCLEVINSPVGKWKVLDGAVVTIADDLLNFIKIKDTPDSKVQVKRKLFAQGDYDDVLEKNAGNNNKIVQLDPESLKQSLIEPPDVVKLDDFNSELFIYYFIMKMLENVNNICSELGVIKNSDLTAVSVLNSENLPISNKETLKNFEMLLESSTFRDKVVSELSLSVGKTIPETISRMMQKLFVDDWLRNYSYIGFLGRNKLSSLHSCRIIFEAVRSSSKFEKVPDMEIALTIRK
ncbi:hypothetical protein QTP88_029384 [Uroleucon formosanum]